MKTKLLIATLAAAFAVQAQADNISITTGTAGGNTVNIGTGSQAVVNAGNHGTAVGFNAQSLSGGTAIGQGAKTETVAVTDSGRSGTANNAVAVGENALATNRGALALGGTTKATGFDSSAVGVVSEAHSQSSSAFGTYAKVETNATNSTALGTRATVKDGAENALAVGNNSVVHVTNSVALGARSEVNAGDAADGTAHLSGEAVAAANGVVSVGKSGAARQIINVAGGIKDTDAVNVAQLKALENQVTALSTGGSSLGARVDALENRVDNVSRQANDGSAIAIATAVMAAPPVGKSGLMVGTGFYRGSNAISIGLAHTADGWGVKAVVSGAGRGNFGGGVGASLFW